MKYSKALHVRMACYLGRKLLSVTFLKLPHKLVMTHEVSTREERFPHRENNCMPTVATQNLQN